MRLRFLFAGLALTLAAACSTEALVSTAFPDRERFAFRTADGDSVFQYACAQLEDAAATRANAEAAHKFTDREFNRIVDRALIRAGRDGNPIRATRQIDAEAEALVDTVEARYSCLAYDFRDA